MKRWALTRVTAFAKKTVKDIPVDGSVVLVRVDYNVPLTEAGEIHDDYRIVASLPTLRYLIDRGCRVVLIAHLGRPEGAVNPAYSLEPVAMRLRELLGQPVHFVAESIGDIVKQTAKRLGAGEVLLLENLRFHAGEEANDASFAKALVQASGAAYFVQDGFGVIHRPHASTSAITAYAPSVAGLLVEKEYRMIADTMAAPKRPLTAIIGGAKVSDKLPLIERFMQIADHIIVGGALANAFLRYRGHEIGKSLYEEGVEAVIERIYAAKRSAELLVLPTDVAVAHGLEADARRSVVGVEDVRHDEYILDVGTDTIQAITDAISQSQTVVWNGTLGMAERDQFAVGSARTALALAQHPDVVSVIGGGDTADFVLKWDGNGGAGFSHISTGGGASLELMAGLPLPGYEALLDA